MSHLAAASTPAGQRPEALLLDIAPDATTDPGKPLVDPACRASAPFVPPQKRHEGARPMAPEHEARPHDPSPVGMPVAPSPAPSSETVLATPAPARFAMRVSTESVRVPDPRSAAAATENATGLEPGGDEAPLAEEAVSSPARLAGPISPAYPAMARSQDVEADVLLALVVTSDGRVADASVLERAGFGFDEEALRALRAARFTPAQRDGRRVGVRMRWTVSFRLR